MKESRLSFRNLSPRIVGLITGFMWLSYHADQLFDLFLNLGEKLLASEEEMMMGHYDEELMIAYTAGDIVSIIISSAIGLIIAVGLLKNHPKIVLAGTVLMAAEGIFYIAQNLMQEGLSLALIAFNGVYVFSVVMIIVSLVSFRGFLTKLSALAVGILNIFIALGAFVDCLRPLYGAEEFFEGANIVLSALDASGFLSRFLIIALNMYVLVLVIYDGKDVQETYDGDAIETYSYLSMKKHLAFLYFFGPVWFIVWVHRSTKVINEIKGEYNKYKPGREALKLIIPFYYFYWSYTQAKRIEEELNKCGAEESGMGKVALLLSVLTTSGGDIYLQDKINEYCIIRDKKLKKKAKYDYDENEGITPEYPVDTTEKKPTEIVIDE